MEIKTRVLKSKKQSPMYMFERMVQHEVEEQTGMQVYASGIKYNENCEMWFFKADGVSTKDGIVYHTFEGYIGTLGKVVITKVDGRREVA